MADVKTINNYNIKDETARNKIATIEQEIPLIQSAIQTLQTRDYIQFKRLQSDITLSPNSTRFNVQFMPYQGISVGDGFTGTGGVNASGVANIPGDIRCNKKGVVRVSVQLRLGVHGGRFTLYLLKNGDDLIGITSGAPSDGGNDFIQLSAYIVEVNENDVLSLQALTTKSGDTIVTNQSYINVEYIEYK